MTNRYPKAVAANLPVYTQAGYIRSHTSRPRNVWRQAASLFPCSFGDRCACIAPAAVCSRCASTPYVLCHAAHGATSVTSVS